MCCKLLRTLKRRGIGWVVGIVAEIFLIIHFLEFKVMANSVYKINKGINKPIEFKGLKAQYIWYLGGGLVILLILFALLYIIGVNTFVCVGLIGVLGGMLFTWVYGISNKYG